MSDSTLTGDFDSGTNRSTEEKGEKGKLTTLIVSKDVNLRCDASAKARSRVLTLVRKA